MSIEALIAFLLGFGWAFMWQRMEVVKLHHTIDSVMQVLLVGQHALLGCLKKLRHMADYVQNTPEESALKVWLLDELKEVPSMDSLARLEKEHGELIEEAKGLNK